MVIRQSVLAMRKTLVYFLSILAMFTLSCETEMERPDCQLTKFSTLTVSTSINHFDIISLKNGKIEQMYSYDHRITRNDTINKTLLFFKYDANQKLIQIRDESPNKKITTFDFEHDDSGKITKTIEKLEGVVRVENTIRYDELGRMASINTTNLLGISRDFEYDDSGNPIIMYRYEINPFLAYRHEFDTMNNFFKGVPEINYLWIVRPLYNFLPFGEHNIKSVRVFMQRGNFWVEDPTLKSTREIEYNSKGYPLIIRRLNDNADKSVITESKFEYNCD